MLHIVSHILVWYKWKILYEKVGQTQLSNELNCVIPEAPFSIKTKERKKKLTQTYSINTSADNDVLTPFDSVAMESKNLKE